MLATDRPEAAAFNVQSACESLPIPSGIRHIG
jgi:hypothetical protein